MRTITFNERKIKESIECVKRRYWEISYTSVFTFKCFKDSIMEDKLQVTLAILTFVHQNAGRQRF